MKHTIRGSDVFVKEDIRALLEGLLVSTERQARHQPREMSGYLAGYTSAIDAVAIALAIRLERHDERIEHIHEVIEYRAERTVERYQAPAPAAPERRFAIRGEREAWPAVEDTALARPVPVNMNDDDVNITLFNPAAGRLVAREVGYGWIGHDGYSAFWNASDWQQVSIDEARAWGNLVPDDWLVLVRHAYANDQRRQIGQSVRVLPTERRQLR